MLNCKSRHKLQVKGKNSKLVFKKWQTLPGKDKNVHKNTVETKKSKKKFILY